MSNHRRITMKIDLTEPGTPSGFTLHATPAGATLSVWVGSRELIAHLDPERLALAAEILCTRTGRMQIMGTVREFTVPTFE